MLKIPALRYAHVNNTANPNRPLIRLSWRRCLVGIGEEALLDKAWLALIWRLCVMRLDLSGVEALPGVKSRLYPVKPSWH